MRFNPKIVRGEEPPVTVDGEIELPADLAALADQLGDDAAHLAACYPPVRATRLSRTPSAPRRKAMPRGKTIAIAAAAIGGAALAALITLSALFPSATMPLAARTSGVQSNPSSTHSLTSFSPGGEATVSLVDLSGPELEAWLDLIASEPSHDISVSF